MRDAVLFAIVVAMIGFSESANTIDLTGALPSQRLREPISVSTSSGLAGGSEGVSGRISPIEASLQSVEPGAGSQPSAILQIAIENQSDRTVEFPIGISPAEFESKSADIPYSFESALISFRSNLRQQPALKIEPLSLYGSESVSGSLRILHPGESLHIRIRALLGEGVPTIGSPEIYKISVGSPPVSLDIIFEHNSVSLQGGILHQDSRQVRSIAH
jgi:hypothetical protein